MNSNRSNEFLRYLSSTCEVRADLTRSKIGQTELDTLLDALIKGDSAELPGEASLELALYFEGSPHAVLFDEVLIPDFLDALEHTLVDVVDVSKADDLLSCTLSSLEALISCDVVLEGLVSSCPEVIPAVQLGDSVSSLFSLHFEALIHGLGMSGYIHISHALQSALLLDIVVSVAFLGVDFNDINFLYILLLEKY